MATQPPGQWLELAVDCDTEAVEPVTELFARFGYNEGVVIEEPYTQDADGDNLAVDPSRPVTVRTFVSVADMPDGRLDEIRNSLWHLGQMRYIGDLLVTERREEDWANAWKEHYHVHRIGRRVVVRAPWHEYEPGPDEVVVVLDPGMAFGTGLHPSSRLCMLGLEEEIVRGSRVLDVGTGSGILAIAAAKLGAAHVDAVDIEPIAVRSAKENAERNGSAESISIAEGSVGEGGPISGSYDLVLANIIARILIDLVEPLAASVGAGGALVLSGVVESREPAVRRAFDAAGLTFDRRAQIEDWVSLTYHRRS
jgi:ribosomal protein L11 methyltransferase